MGVYKHFIYSSAVPQKPQSSNPDNGENIDDTSSRILYGFFAYCYQIAGQIVT